MTTTDNFQKKKDYYSTKEECEKSEKEKVSINPRYPYFFQTHFTAGDEEQFNRYRNKTNESFKELEIDSDLTNSPNFPLSSNINFEKYRNLYKYICKYSNSMTSNLLS